MSERKKTDMKKIRIFIGSSIDELKIERKDLASFIQGLNNKYVDRGIYIEPYRCEEEPPKMSGEGSQSEIDKYIEDSADAAFFLFFTKAGEYTLHELDIARKILVEQNRPDIYVFFKTLGTEPMDTEEIKKAVDKIANTYGHYYKNFKEIDTVKLAMLQYISETLNLGQSIEVLDGKIYFDGIEMRDISLDNIFAYQNNRNYQNLKKEIADLRDKIKVLAESGDLDELIKLNRILEEKKEQFSTLEKTIISVMIKLQQKIKKNKNPILIEAFKLTEHGEIEKALKILPSEESIRRDSEIFCKKHELAEAVEKADAEKNIAEAKARIEILKAEIENPDRFSEIIRIYDSICKQCEIVKDLDTLFDEIAFLHYQNHIKECFEKACRLDKVAYREDDRIYAKVQNAIGSCKETLNGPEKAEEHYVRAIEIQERLVKTSPEQFEPDLAKSYNDIGSLYYFKQDNHQKAEEYLQKAIEIRERLAKSNSERFGVDLANSYETIGHLYFDQGNHQKAEEYLQKAMEILERLAEVNPDRFESHLAIYYFGIGSLYCNITLLQKLAKVIPDSIEPDLAMSYNSIGGVYNEQGNLQKAEECYKKGIEILERSAQVNPDRTEPYLAICYNLIGSLYFEQGNHQKAEEYYKKAMEILERLAKSNPERFEPDLAKCYGKVGKVYSDQGNLQKADECYKKGIGILERLAKTNSERFGVDLAKCYGNVGMSYRDQDEHQKAEEYLQKAVEILERLAKVNPDRFEPDLARSYNNMGDSYRYQGNLRIAEEYYKKGIEILKRLAKVNPDRFEPDLATCYAIIGLLCFQKTYLQKAVELAEKYPENQICRLILEKGDVL